MASGHVQHMDQCYVVMLQCSLGPVGLVAGPRWRVMGFRRRIRMCIRRLFAGPPAALLVDGAVRHLPFKPDILFFHQAHPAELAHAQMRVLLALSVEEAGLADAELPAEVSNRGPTLGLPDSIDDLLFGESLPLHRSPPFVEDLRSRCRTLVLTCRRFSE